MRVHLNGLLILLLLGAGPSACKKTSTSPSTGTGGTTGTAPVITSISPTSGTSDGGTPVTITGSGFSGATAVNFGTSPSPAYSVTDDTTLVANTPAAAPGTLSDVTVVSATGTSATGNFDLFSWGQNELSTFTFSADTVKGGTPVTGTITLIYPVSTAVTLPLTFSTDPAGSTAFLVPLNITIPAASATATFQVTTFFVSSPQKITVNTFYQNVNDAISFTITP